jgi:hypothetical protein
MANSFNKPIILDTAMGSDFWATISVPAGQGKPIRVKKIVWTNPGAAGAGTFVITDASTAANVLAQGNAPAASLNVDQQIDFEQDTYWRNWKLTTLTGGGKLLIYYD